MAKEGCLAGLAITLAMSILARCRHVNKGAKATIATSCTTPTSACANCAPGVEQSALPSAAWAQNAGQLAGSGVWLARALCGVLLRVKVYFEDSFLRLLHQRHRQGSRLRVGNLGPWCLGLS